MPDLVMLAHRFEKADVDPTGWWASEKLDGVRGYWTGKKLISRSGKIFHAPAWFIRSFPAEPIDGELWLGRGQFNECSGIVRRHDWGDDAKRIKFVVFDAPDASGGFEDRQKHLQRIVSKTKAKHLIVHTQTKLKSREAMYKMLHRVEDLGGEGLIIRAPGSAYECRRSWQCLKVKSFQDDEAIVIGHQPGKGKHKGRLGALLCELPDGTQFKVGTGFSDAEREEPVEIGNTITFGYFELSKDGVPRFPTFIRERHPE